MNDLPLGWTTAPIAAVADLVRGVTYNKADAIPSAAESYLPILRATNINGRLSLESEMVFVPDRYVRPEQRMQVGDIVVATSSGSASVVGKSAQLLQPWEGGFGAFCTVIRPSAQLASRYLAHLVASPSVRKNWRELARGTSINNLKASDLANTDVPLPPTAEQERIVAAIEEQFSRVDAGAVVLERVSRNLKYMRASVLYAGVTGRLVDQESREGSGADLLASIKLDGRRTSRRRESLVTPMPQLPLSWATARWSAVGWSQNGRAFPSADYAKEGRRLLRPGNLYASGRVDWTAANTRCLPEHYAHEFPDYIVGPGEIVMNLTAQSLKDEFLGRVCMTAPKDEPVLLNQRIARLTPAGMNPRFVFYVLKSPIFRRFVDQLNTGSLIQHMFTTQVDQFLLPVPPRGEQDRIVERIEQHLASLDHVEHSLYGTGKQMSALRAAILSAAFSGRLVPQDRDDEPASVLLERIASERALNGHRRGRSRKTRLLRDEVTA